MSIFYLDYRRVIYSVTNIQAFSVQWSQQCRKSGGWTWTKYLRDAKRQKQSTSILDCPIRS